MKKLILIAEDYDDTRSYMSFLIKSFGYEVFEATNGEEAVDIAKHSHPDLILMDISMPRMDGLTATQIIRNSEESISRTPIIAVTAFGSTFKDKAIDAGCDYLITKPVDIEQLEPILNKYLEK